MNKLLLQYMAISFKNWNSSN